MYWGLVIMTVIAYIPVFYRMNNRIRILEDKINCLLIRK
jgi:hypothetical protein